MRDTGYDPRSFPPIAVTVDVVLFAILEGELHLLLIERAGGPFRGCLALPGGFVQPSDANLDRAAERELEEETGIRPGAAYLEQLGTYGARDRDPRMRVVSVAYWAACARPPIPRGGGDAARAELVPASWCEHGGLDLAFDHGQIARDALARLRAKLEYTALGVRFCPPAFTISQLREVYEAVWNTELDAGNFQRKVRYNESFRQIERQEGLAAAAAWMAEERELDTRAQAAPTADEEERRGVRASRQSSLALDAEEAEGFGGPPMAAAMAPPSSMEEAAFHDETMASAPASPPPFSFQDAAMAGPQRSSGWSSASRLGEPPRSAAVAGERPLVRPGRRGGRPASLWTAEDPAAMLNSPIARPSAARGDED